MRLGWTIAGVLVLACWADGQTVRVVDQEGRPVEGMRVVFSCDDGPQYLRRLHKRQVDAALPAPPLEEQPEGGVGIVVLTDERGEATALPGEYVWWVARAVRGDEGVEAEFSQEDSDGAVVEMRLQPLRRVRVLHFDGSPAAGVEVRHHNIRRTVHTSADGSAVVVSAVASRRLGEIVAGVEWVAPGSRLLERWAEGPGSETVLRLPPVGRLVVVDAENIPGGPWAKLRAGDLEHSMRNGGSVTFPVVPAHTPISLYLTAQFYEGWERIVVLEAGETTVVTFREPAKPVTIEGTVITHSSVPGPLSVLGFFVDREPGEPASEAAVEAGGTFALKLVSRRPVQGRDVVLFLKPSQEKAALRSPFDPVRKRLGPATREAVLQIGVLDPVLVPAWFEGTVTDMRGRPMAHLDLEVDWLGCRGGGGYACSEGEFVPVFDPDRPRLEAWPQRIRTDGRGRFSVAGNRLDRNFQFTLPDGRKVLPDSVEPSLDVHLIVGDARSTSVEVDASLARVDDRKATLDFEACLEATSGTDRPIVVKATVWVEPPTEGEELRPWSAVMALGPGRWLISMRVDGSADIVGEGVVDVQSPPDSEDAPAQHAVLHLVRALSPLRHATITVVGPDGQPCRGADVRQRSRPDEDWDWVGADPVVDVLFSGETVEVAASAEGFLPTAARIGPGPITLRLVPAPSSTLRARVAPFPAGVQDNVEWSVRVSCQELVKRSWPAPGCPDGLNGR
jgi:protocatechuate 3,4-dioxygenase beta subunit